MTIKWTGYTRIELGDGTAISVNSEAPSSPSAHSEVVDAIIEAVGKIEDSDEPDEPDKPTYDAIADTGEVMIGGSVNEADPKPEEPAGNQAAPLNESKPKLLIDIATAKNSSEGDGEDDLAYLPQLVRGVRPR